MQRFCIMVVMAGIAFAAPAAASELVGGISTNPSAVAPNPVSDSEERSSQANREPFVQPGESQPVISEGREGGKSDAVREERVLGQRIVADGALLRGPDMRVYIIEGAIKKHIASIEELRRYAGWPITDVDAARLAHYQTRSNLNGELIRQHDDVKVYVIVNGSRRHIHSLEELRKRYFGLEIYNIPAAEMQKYPKL